MTSIKVFYNHMDCPYRNCCPDAEEREKILIKHRCSFNPSIFDCKSYQGRTDESIEITAENVDML